MNRTVIAGLVLVGFSHTTGQITHHVDADVDAERDRIVSEIKAAGGWQQSEYIDNFQQQTEGRNGGGDPWRTDRRLGVIVIQTAPSASESSHGR